MEKTCTILDVKNKIKCKFDIYLGQTDIKLYDELRLESLNKQKIKLMINTSSKEDVCLEILKQTECYKANMTGYFRVMIKKGYLKCVKYMHENSQRCNTKTSYKFYIEQNYESYRLAAEYGHLDCVKYTHENGCPWNEDTCMHAAFGGSLECLKYAIENDCPYDKQVCIDSAKEKGHEHIIVYLESTH